MKKKVYRILSIAAVISVLFENFCVSAVNSVAAPTRALCCDNYGAMNIAIYETESGYKFQAENKDSWKGDSEKKNDKYKRLLLSADTDKYGGLTGSYSFDTRVYLPVFDSEYGVIRQSETERKGNMTSGYFTPLTENISENKGQAVKEKSFIMVAEGRFVYRSEVNMYFSYEGEADMYLYVNGFEIPQSASENRGQEKNAQLNAFSDAACLNDGEEYAIKLYVAAGNGETDLGIHTNISIYNGIAAAKTRLYSEDGSSIPSGAMVSKDENVFCALRLENRSGMPLYEMSFASSELGLLLSPESTQLCDAAGGVNMAISDMELEYYSLQEEAEMRTTSVIVPSCDEELKKLMSDGLAANSAVEIKGFRIKTGKNKDRACVNVRAVYRTGSGKSAEYQFSSSGICAVFVDESADKITLALENGAGSEYGKEQLFTAEQLSALKALSPEIHISASIASEKGRCGKACFSSETLSFSYTPEKFMNADEYFQINVSYYTGSRLTSLTKTIRVVPAAAVCYDDSFQPDRKEDGIEYTGGWEADGENHVSVTTNEKLINGKDKAFFSFKGTGFELFSEKGPGAGVAMVYLYSGKSTCTTPLRIIRADAASLMSELENTPLVSVSDLEYGEYTVVIIVSASDLLVEKNPDKNGKRKIYQTLTETSRTRFTLSGIRIIEPGGKLKKSGSFSDTDIDTDGRITGKDSNSQLRNGTEAKTRCKILYGILS